MTRSSPPTIRESLRMLAIGLVLLAPFVGGVLVGFPMQTYTTVDSPVASAPADAMVNGYEELAPAEKNAFRKASGNPGEVRTETAIASADYVRLDGEYYAVETAERYGMGRSLLLIPALFGVFALIGGGVPLLERGVAVVGRAYTAHILGRLGWIAPSLIVAALAVSLVVVLGPYGYEAVVISESPMAMSAVDSGNATVVHASNLSTPVQESIRGAITSAVERPADELSYAVVEDTSDASPTLQTATYYRTDGEYYHLKTIDDAERMLLFGRALVPAALVTLLATFFNIFSGT